MPIPALHRFGWIPDIPDQRDRPYALLVSAAPHLPAKTDHRSLCTPVEDQGNLGSCTAQALVGNLEFLKKKSLEKSLNFSRLFVYYNERVLLHTVRVDSGAQLRDGIKTLVKLGTCLESLWPYEIETFDEKPSEKAYIEALEYQITSYYRLHTLQEMRQTLAAGFPFVFGISVYSSFEEYHTATTGMVSLPRQSETLLGGHALMAVGYDDDNEWIIFRNSWGPHWGNHGYGYIPYEYIRDRDLSDDFWTIRDME